MSTIKCDIVSAEKSIFSGEVVRVYATGQMGELGIAPRHAPLLTRLAPGQVRVQTEDGEEQFYYISGGLLEVQPHLVTVLADTAERAEDLDEAAALRAKENAERKLADKAGERDLAEVQLELAMAQAQLHALARLKKNIKR
ncbi:MAG: F0F1 ATP synthase subunit epsilon [Gammaproteobacteria bacterium]|jgi:F-type H+-transporting ATPase subunit epsilon|nr:F0F1 ATP synthase subunit epsilon [Gammaproteobacteria bacterium]